MGVYPHDWRRSLHMWLATDHVESGVVWRQSMRLRSKQPVSELQRFRWSRTRFAFESMQYLDCMNAVNLCQESLAHHFYLSTFESVKAVTVSSNHVDQLSCLDRSVDFCGLLPHQHRSLSFLCASSAESQLVRAASIRCC